MSLLYPRDCLAFHKARALSTAKSLADRPTAEIAKQLRDFSGHGSKEYPEASAITFYALNHAVAAISKQKAPHDKLTAFEQEVVETYYREATLIGLRSFYYLLLITVREARHLKNEAVMHKKYAGMFGSDVMAYINSVPDSPTEAMNVFTKKPAPGTLGNFAGALQAVFHTGSWSSGFGGPAWGRIADCMASFIRGDTSMEQMTDTVFTLAHNNGPIYNKGVYFHNYSSELLYILDVQASGQVPNGILNPANKGDTLFRLDKLKPQVVALMKAVGREFPEFTTPIDWFKVTALGGKKNYTVWMNDQLANGFHSPYEDQVKLGKSKPVVAKAKGVPVKKPIYLGSVQPKVKPHIVSTGVDLAVIGKVSLAPGLVYSKVARAA